MGVELRTERNLSREERVRRRAFEIYEMFKRNGFKEDHLRDYYYAEKQIDYEDSLKYNE